MCGISAFIAFQDHSLEAKYIELMNNQIRHRGPDDEGYYLIDTEDNDCILAGNDSIPHNQSISYSPYLQINQYYNKKIKLALGHRRLSIVDLSAHGHQPLSINNGDYWIAFNGEVYNFIELREELESLGYTFSSQSDTEVILSAYKQWGADCLNKFNGMFAIIIYDKINNKIFVARDRFGIKPLYYYIDENGIFFASEIKQFINLPTWQARLNHQRAFDFLVYALTDHTEETLFKEVRQLKGGEYILFPLLKLTKLKTKTILHNTWFDLNDNNYKGSYKQAISDFKKYFTDSINIHFRADVDIGSCLSGGLDSSSIVSTASKLLSATNTGTKIKTFSAGSNYKEFDESYYINIVTKETATQSHFCIPDIETLFNSTKLITWHQDEPFGSTSIFAQWSVFQLAHKNKVKVMLDGQGADEQLCGYQGLYFQTIINQLLRKRNLIKLIRELYLINKHHALNIKKLLTKGVISLLPYKIHSLLIKLLNRKSYNLDYLDDKILHFNNISPYSIKKYLATIKYTSYSQIMKTNLPMLLHFEDRNSMAHSIESRVPFLDYRLVEFIYSLPDHYKITDGITKRILRDSLEGIIPKEIQNRMDKLGFATPEEIWVKKNASLFRQKIEYAIEKSNGILKKDKVLFYFDQIISEKRPFDFWIWRIINFGEWVETFNVKV